MSGPLEDGFRLDRRWYALRDGVDRSKEPDLSLLAAVLARQQTPYAIIGGIALQVHQQEPRTTLDIDVAVATLGGLPRAALMEAGFRESGRYAHNQNWLGPDGTPVQFTDDPTLASAVPRAVDVPLGKLVLRVLAKTDLLHEKLRSKRLQDLADAQALLEEDPALESELTSEERALLDRLPR